MFYGDFYIANNKLETISNYENQVADEGINKNFKTKPLYINNLNKLYYTEPKNSAIGKFLSKCYNIILIIQTIFNSRTLESYRTQEHLIKGFGSHLNAQTQAFRKHFAEKSGEGFEKLNRELTNGMLADTGEILKRKFLPGGEKRWAENVKAKLEQLKPGESLWVDASSLKAYHAMVMRLTKNEDGTFDLQYANTGAGMEKNPDFHPKAPQNVTDPNRVNNYQLVGLIEKIPADRLQGDFFHTFAHISETGEVLEGSSFQNQLKSEIKNKQSVKKDANILENDQTINLMYCALRCLGTPVTSKDPRYYHTQQIGNSCAAMSMWAMVRVVLSDEEFEQTQRDMRIDSLVHHYKQIKEGYDQSSTRKIMVLDLIQSLKIDIKDPILEKIEEELKEDLKMLDPEVKISKTSSVNIDDYIQEKKSGFFLSPFKVDLSTRIRELANPTLVAHVSIKKENNKQYTYKVNKGDDSNKWEGADLLDKTALLVFYTANGNHEESKVQLESVMNAFDQSEMPIQKALDTIVLLGNLAHDFKSFDNTRSGIAKSKCLLLLAIKELIIASKSLVKYLNIKGIKIDINDYSIFDKHDESNKEKDVNWQEIENIRNELSSLDSNSGWNTLGIFDYLIDIYERTNKKYRDLKVSTVLSDDNIWKKALNELQKVPPASAPSKTEQSNAKPIELEKLIDEASVTDGKTCQTAEHILANHS